MAIFAGLLQFSSNRLAQSFLDTNPFAVKAAAINLWIERLFVALAAAGVVIQAVVYVLGERLPEALYTWQSYAVVFGIAGAGTAGVLALIAILARRLAKRSWVPLVFEAQKGLFDSVAFAADHDGWLRNYWEASDTHEEWKKPLQNDDEVSRLIAQVEELFLGRIHKGSLADRVNRLRPTFYPGQG
jgi:hypothetical protein